jgi:hypothetical protein
LRLMTVLKIALAMSMEPTTIHHAARSDRKPSPSSLQLEISLSWDCRSPRC